MAPVTVAFAGDTMLGRCVAEVISGELSPHVARMLQARSEQSSYTRALFSDTLLRVLRTRVDALVINLECCVSSRGAQWPYDPRKPFFFRAPPAAVREIHRLVQRDGDDDGDDGAAAQARVPIVCSLANNHALDYGYDALADTLRLLEQAGIRHVGAGRNVREAREAVVVDVPVRQRGGNDRDDETTRARTASAFRLKVVACTDHPLDFAADAQRAGVALAHLRDANDASAIPAWLRETLARHSDHAADEVCIAFNHWGPNMNPRPLPYVRRAATAMRAAGADLVLGHSAHNIQGVHVGERVVYDMGDFIDDYAVDSDVRNDLGLLYLVTWPEHTTPAAVRVEAYPLKLEFCHTRLAECSADEGEWVARRLRAMSAELDSADGMRVEYERVGGDRVMKIVFDM